jgi:hypothetical protein
MSNLSDILFSAQDGKLVENLAARFGLSPEQTRAAVKALLPALSTALSRAAEHPETLGKVIDAVAEPSHHSAFGSADHAHSDDGVEQGRQALTQLFGSSAATGQIAQLAAGQTGLRADLMGQLLPVLASVVLGGLFKNFSSQGLGSIIGALAGGGGVGAILEQLARGGLGGAMGGGAPAPQPASSSGPLGGILGSILGGLLGGGRSPGGQPAPQGGLPGGFQLPGGLDPATVQAAIEKIRNTLQPPGAGPGAQSHAQNPELGDILDKVFGQKR